LPPRLPAPLVQIVGRALAKDPAQRYVDGAAMAEALLEARRSAAGSSAGARRSLGGARRTARGAAHVPRLGLSRASAGDSAGDSARGSGATSTIDPPRDAPDGSTPPTPPLPPLPPGGPNGTRRAAPLSPRRNVNPAGRRRAAAALGVVIALLGAMVAAALVIGHTTYTHVPALMHESQGRAAAAARRAHVRLTFGHRHSPAPAHTVVGQAPHAGRRVASGTVVHVTISTGPAPVPVLAVSHETVGDAEQSLHSAGLRTVVHDVPAPGTTPGIVVAQDPVGGTTRPRGSMVTLSVAEVPRWRTVTTFDGRSSGLVHIRGERWRVVYRMAFQGTCTFILFCSGPSARVTDAAGSYVAGFGLQNGSNQEQIFSTGPGSYEIQVTPGGDDAGWSAQVQDRY
jgi:eukaryotic-like serine/threonine-protein kinase